MLKLINNKQLVKSTKMHSPYFILIKNYKLKKNKNLCLFNFINRSTNIIN